MEDTNTPVQQAAENETVAAAQPMAELKTRTEQYVKLRDLIKEKDDAHKAAMAPYRETLEKLNNFLLDQLNTIGVDSVKSEAGTVYRTNKKSMTLENAEEFMQFVIATDRYELLDRKANLKAVEDYVGENGVLPPGAKFSTHAVVGVRRG